MYNLPDESKDTIPAPAINLLMGAQIPNHKNTTKDERKTKNCFVVMDQNDKKMQNLINNQVQLKNIKT